MSEDFELNNIYNLDSYSAVKKINDKSVDCIYIDIPYLFYKGGKSSTLIGQRLCDVYKDIKDFSNGIDYSIFDDFKRIMKKINIFIWCSTRQMKEVINYWLSIKNVKMELFVWCKTNPVPKNNCLLTNVEYCLWFRDVNVKVNGDYHNKSKYYVSVINRIDKKLYKHATIKPLDFVKNHILCATSENDLVVDFFSGSGTTAVACKELKRNFICFEIKKENYINSLKRLNNDFINDELRKFEQIKLF